jgi:Holliday junction resolvasome RuvABC endonuclease subunit
LRVVGIDPGSANCGVEGDQAIAALKLSSVAGMIDPAQLARLVLEWKPDAAAIERVGARPLQGRSSTFKFGYGAGLAHGVLAGLMIPVHFINPREWQSHFRLLRGDPDLSRSVAARLYPSMDFSKKNSIDAAEALLIARYAHERILI